MTAPLLGKVAFVTGGTRGIGRAISLALAKAGANLAINYLRNKEEAVKTEKAIQSIGVRCIRLKGHLGNPKQISSMFQTIKEEFGTLDILINNAASGVNRPGIELNEKHFDWTLNTNLKGPWLSIKEAVPIMNPGGRIINVTSLGSQRVLRNYTSVGISKAALEALTRYMAIELAPRGINVNAISPGYINTDALSHFPNEEQMIRDATAITPNKQILTAEDIGKVVLFLATDDASMIRGQVIIVDGGMSLIN